MFLDEFDHIIKISIHALREEGDQILLDAHAANNVFLSTPSARRATLCGSDFVGEHSDFYPRPPRGGRPERVVVPDRLKGFLSTPSARRATDVPVIGRNPGYDFYPRPPRGGRPSRSKSRFAPATFLSTPSARRATRGSSARCIPKKRFLSTPSARRATMPRLAPER